MSSKKVSGTIAPRSGDQTGSAAPSARTPGERRMPTTSSEPISKGAAAAALAILDAVGEAVMAVDKRYLIISWNRAAEEMFGYSREEAIGMSLTRLMPPDFRAEFARDVGPMPPGESMRVLGEDPEKIAQRADGSQFYVELSVSESDCFGGDSAYIAIMRDVSARKEAESALKRSEEKYRALFEKSPEGITLVSLDGKIIECNGETARIAGSTIEALVSMNFLHVGVLPPEGLPGYPALFQNLLAGERLEPFVTNVVQDGQMMWLEISLSVVGEGKDASILVISRDITTRMDAEDALRESEMRYQQYLDLAPVAFVSLGKDGRITFCNRKGGELLRCSQDGLAGEDWFESFVPPDERGAVREVFDQLMAGQIDRASYYENHVIGPDGSRKLIGWHNAVITGSDGQPVGTLSSGLDLTPLAESERKFRLLADQLPVPVFEISREGGFTFANRVAFETFGYPKGDIEGRTLFDMLDSADHPKVHRRMASILQGRGTSNNEYTAVTRDGRRFPVAIWSAPIHEGDEIVGVRGIVIDMSTQKKLEMEQSRAAKTSALEQLAGGIAHDFNNILAGIAGYASLVKSTPGLDPATKEDCEQIQVGVDRGKDLTGRLAAFSREEAPEKKIVEIGSLLRRATNHALPGSGIRPTFDIPEGLWQVNCDTGQIFRVVQNLAINASHALEAGNNLKTLKISARNVTLEDCQVPSPEWALSGSKGAYLSPGRYVEITIQDSGIGIPEDKISHIFDAGFTTKETGKGMGLGLSTSLRIVRNHEGGMVVESEVDVGTTFRIYLPAARNSVPSSEADAGVIRGTGRILVMDDEETIRKVLRKQLEGLGYEALSVSCGDDALAEYERALKEGNPFSAVLMDLTILGGMGGEEAIQLLLGIDPSAKVIVSSGYATSSAISDYQALGFKGALQKPFRLGELSVALHEVIKGNGC
ncbi:MAG: PAS domain S-box protein [Candidatus Micrarchaeota archaeon]